MNWFSISFFSLVAVFSFIVNAGWTIESDAILNIGGDIELSEQGNLTVPQSLIDSATIKKDDSVNGLLIKSPAGITSVPHLTIVAKIGNLHIKTNGDINMPHLTIKAPGDGDIFIGGIDKHPMKGVLISRINGLFFFKAHTLPA